MNEARKGPKDDEAFGAARKVGNNLASCSIANALTLPTVQLIVEMKHRERERMPSVARFPVFFFPFGISLRMLCVSAHRCHTREYTLSSYVELARREDIPNGVDRYYSSSPFPPSVLPAHPQNRLKRSRKRIISIQPLVRRPDEPIAPQDLEFARVPPDLGRDVLRLREELEECEALRVVSCEVEELTGAGVGRRVGVLRGEA